MFRYDPAQFARLPRARFIQALGAEGISAAEGYGPLHKASFITDVLKSRP
jgi:hypothetical protein